VLVLQHPLEVGNAKNSALLLHLSLPNSRLVVGEVFDPAQLHSLLYAPWLPGAAQVRQPVLLYPSGPGEANDAAPAALPSSPPLPTWSVGAQPRLIVIDGTWRKSRKILHLNPLLQTLPRLSLQGTTGSRYVIRKAHRPDQLSTLEATCHALAQLEGKSSSTNALLAAFDGFVAQHIGLRPGVISPTGSSPTVPCNS
jgi:DTW domain-containing protein YfiP